MTQRAGTIAAIIQFTCQAGDVASKLPREMLRRYPVATWPAAVAPHAAPARAQRRLGDNAGEQVGCERGEHARS